ncbi:MAG: NUDIX domain-containing protein [Bacilli bacterium]|nr:NUDIX domain-containing protein [Bacilli bacterium]
MKYIKINKDRLNKEDITKEDTRIKALIINSKNEILLGYSYHCYQFIGGHLEKGESLIACLKREVKEEVGIILDIKQIEPFLFKEEYYKDYPTTNENYNCKIYYYVIQTDLLPDPSKINYTNEEKIGNFQYQYIPLDKFEEIIISNGKKRKEAEMIGHEMLIAFREYQKIAFKK